MHNISKKVSKAIKELDNCESPQFDKFKDNELKELREMVEKGKIFCSIYEHERLLAEIEKRN